MLQGFANGGCYDEIDRRLGYRFRLVSGTYSATLMRGDTLQLELQVANDGFATMFNRRPVFAVLYKGAEQYACQLAADPRTWRPNTVTTISQSCGLSSTMSSGTYTLALWLPDQSSSIVISDQLNQFCVKGSGCGTLSPIAAAPPIANVDMTIRT